MRKKKENTNRKIIKPGTDEEETEFTKKELLFANRDTRTDGKNSSKQKGIR
jgi:hypothetical protein